MPAAPPLLLLLAGPTAVGKSEIAILLAEQLAGEIVSVDSMQVYRGLDLGTAKPTPAERARVPHHLLDVVDLSTPFDAAQFAALARQAVAEIQSRGKLPILCGGTGLYFKALLEGLVEVPPATAGLRAELEAAPLEELLHELAARDPETFARIDRRNPRRVIRAVEVIRLTGKPFSTQRPSWNSSSAAPAAGAPMICLERSAEDLRQRIDVRVEAMFASGLVTETRELLARGLEANRNAMQAIGYRQVVEHLRGERSLADTVEQVKARTRQYARRQRTWFRRQAAATWLRVEPHEPAAETARRVWELTNAAPRPAPGL